MPIRAVSEPDFRQEVLDSEIAVVVDFYADWCGPCKQIASALDVLSHEMGWKDPFRQSQHR